MSDNKGSQSENSLLWRLLCHFEAILTMTMVYTVFYSSLGGDGDCADVVKSGSPPKEEGPRTHIKGSCAGQQQQQRFRTSITQLLNF